MSEEKKLFLPLFYNTLEFTESLTNEEFGRLVRELLRSGGSTDYKPTLPQGLIIAYNFMLDNAIKIFNLNFNRPMRNLTKQASEKKNTGGLHSIDADAAFEKALSRSSE